MMGFTLKKILSAFLMPLSIGLFLFIIGLIYLYCNNYKKAKIYLGISFLWIFIVGYSPFANKLLTPLELSYPKLEKTVTVKYVLLLGGDYDRRSREAIRLYHSIENVKIITSGFKDNDNISEALKSANKLIQLGIPEEDILIQDVPKDTEEEAKYIKKIIGNEQFIVVTSASHMPRAIELFKKYGLDPIAAPTNFLVDKTKVISLPNAKNLLKSEIAFHEYLGRLWNIVKIYKVKLLEKIESD